MARGAVHNSDEMPVLERKILLEANKCQMSNAKERFSNATKNIGGGGMEGSSTYMHVRSRMTIDPRGACSYCRFVILHATHTCLGLPEHVTKTILLPDVLSPLSRVRSVLLFPSSGALVPITL